MKWISVKEQMPDRKEPIVYCRPKPNTAGVWHIGIGYWTVSDKWNPEARTEYYPDGYTHWMPLPDPPTPRQK